MKLVGKKLDLVVSMRVELDEPVNINDAQEAIEDVLRNRLLQVCRGTRVTVTFPAVAT